MLKQYRPKLNFTNTSKQQNPETDLSARLRSLRNGSLSPSPAAKDPRTTDPLTIRTIPADVSDPLGDNLDSDNKSLDELLAEIGFADQWALNPDDPDDIQKLLNEAKSVLGDEPATAKLQNQERRIDSPDGPKTTENNVLTRDLAMSAFAADDEEARGRQGKSSKLEDESREAQDIVARLLDEVNLGRANEPEPEKDAKSEMEFEEDDEETGERPLFSLPSAPVKLPERSAEATPSNTSLSFELDIAARMAALKGLGSMNELGLPDAPTFKPADKPAKGVMKKYLDEEIDTWCIICQDNATVKCLGCDGDLYCANCWKEGHMGPDVGYEERGHKWTKYKRPN